MTRPAKPTISGWMPKLSDAENARPDLAAEAEFAAGIGISAEDVFGYLHNLIDGIKSPEPKGRKLF